MSTSSVCKPLMDLKVLTWNIDGLQSDEGDRMRTASIIQLIRSSGADVVCLQEVVDSTRAQMATALASTHSLVDPPGAQMPYYTALLIRKGTVSPVSSFPARRIAFTGDARSRMGRDVLVGEFSKTGFRKDGIGVVESEPFRILCSHLESGAEKDDPISAQKRQLQYIQLLNMMGVQETGGTVPISIACGDFNLRVAEAAQGLKATNTVFYDTYDVSDAKRYSTLKTTWERMASNGQGQLMRARFDRQLFSGAGLRLVEMPEGYSLIGNSPVVSRDHPLAVRRGYCTPSDHFGILCSYSIQCIDSCKSRDEVRNVVNISDCPTVAEQLELSPIESKAIAWMKEKEREKRAEAALRRLVASSEISQDSGGSFSITSTSSTSRPDINLKEDESLLMKRKRKGSTPGPNTVIDLTHDDEDD